MGIINSEVETAFKKTILKLAKWTQLFNQNTKGMWVFSINMNVGLTCEQKRRGVIFGL